MYRKRFAVLLCIFLFLQLCGCRPEMNAGSSTPENSHYRVVYGDNACWIEPGKDMKKDIAFLQEDGRISYIYFDSLSDMRRRFVEADFDKDEWYALIQFEKDASGNLCIPDLNHLYFPVIPEEINFWGNFVIAEGASDSYIIDFRYNSNNSALSNGTIECNITDERFIGLLEEDYNSALYNGYKIISQTREEKRNAEVYIYQKNGSTQKRLLPINSTVTQQNIGSKSDI